MVITLLAIPRERLPHGRAEISIDFSVRSGNAYLQRVMTSTVATAWTLATSTAVSCKTNLTQAYVLNSCTCIFSSKTASLIDASINPQAQVASISRVEFIICIPEGFRKEYVNFTVKFENPDHGEIASLYMTFGDDFGGLNEEYVNREIFHVPGVTRKKSLIGSAYVEHVWNTGELLKTTT